MRLYEKLVKIADDYPSVTILAKNFEVKPVKGISPMKTVMASLKVGAIAVGVVLVLVLLGGIFNWMNGFTPPWNYSAPLSVVFLFFSLLSWLIRKF